MHDKYRCPDESIEARLGAVYVGDVMEQELVDNSAGQTNQP
jgi:hypothetical protein